MAALQQAFYALYDEDILTGNLQATFGFRGETLIKSAWHQASPFHGRQSIPDNVKSASDTTAHLT
jgi:hypothetical protein